MKQTPRWLTVAWLSAAPLGVAFAARMVWEKTILTARSGEQMIGFSLAHRHPLLFLGGVLCSYFLMLWLIPALYFLLKTRFRASAFHYGMVATSCLDIVAMFLPSNTGLLFR
jgi:hypothetical protein